ncbi:flagellar filament capping protein FliD [Halomonas mongoliensis]|uniref:Flagellar hook-associated protein 2 n=1 Tax=Halomonas mongoliensis TaxID=321265 RepID=A0ABU1GPH0_9GAMM|nr:flagellar filament capping protein FliD [Halomonas mongoliensis]MDR5893338.1 flagellar filament capping protein FliD [Halomonas mongoliensis]
MSTITALGVGSGLDLSGLLDQLRDAERGKLEPIKRQQAQQQAKISAFGQLQSSLTKFQDSVAKLNDASLYQSLSANVRGDAFTATTSKTAQPGSYSVEVSQLATAGTLATTAADTRDEPLFTQADTLTLNFGAIYDSETGELDTGAEALRSVTIAIEENWTLEDLRDAINADEEAGVTASIVNDGNGYRLALASQETGAEASLTGLTFEHADLGEDADTLRAGRDASINVNGIAITSATNRVEGAIQGVTLNLEETTAEGQPITLRVEQDTLKAREAVQGFVKAFNDMKETIGKLTSFNADTGQAGELNGDSAVRTIESRLRGVLAGGVGEGELRTLNQVGITLQRDGTLKLDDGKLNELTSGNMSGLGEFFAGADSKGGLAGSLNTTLGQLLDGNGIVKRSISGAETRVKSLGERFERMEVSIERTIDRYRVQFGQLDSMIAQMNQTSAYLTQQFDMLADLGNPRKR